MPYVLVTPSNGMNYPNAEHIRAIILKAGTKTGKGIHPVIVNCSFLRTMDFTSAKV